MAIDHEEHKIRVKAISDRMSHPIEYNDAGAPKMDHAMMDGKMHKEEMRKLARDSRFRDMITGGR